MSAVASPQVDAFEDDDLDDELRAQRTAIAAQPAIYRWCHPPAPNNFVFVVEPRRDDRGPGTARRAATLAPLNSIDEELVAWLSGFVDAVAGDEQRARCQPHLETWRAAQAANANLVGVEHAVAVLKILGTSCDLSERLREQRPDIVAAIGQLSTGVRCGVRLALYAPYQLAGPIADLLVAGFADQFLLDAIDTIEIAKILDEAPGVIRHPAVMVYLDIETLATEPTCAAAVADIVVATGGTIGLDVASTSEQRHAVGLGPSVELAQGFRLLKRYLAPIGLLDDLYDPTTAHAFAHPFSDVERAARRALDHVVGR